ncbi:MAG TPA: hypothetical protein VN783_04995 [Thermoanaerobaculia bacterium]|nr:hypothetical protein [Thermoanaerobaculia bacterium]
MSSVLRWLPLSTLALCAASPCLAQGTSTLPAPVVVFATPGVKQVSLQACNSAGCNTAQKNVTVESAVPAILSATALPGTVESGDLVKLSGSGSGAPPLTYTWRITQGLTPVATLPGATLWWDTAGAAPGLYAAQLTVSNSFDQALSLPLPILVVTSPVRSFFTVSPCRVLDTRNTVALASGVARSVAIAAAACGVPATARAISANISVTTPTGSGQVVVYPGNYPKPGTFSLNFSAGQTRTNNLILALANDGTATLAVDATVSGTSGTVQFILDVNGYFE